MKLVIWLCFLTTMFSSTILFANEEVLSKTNNDDNNEVYNLIVDVDETTQTLKGLFKDTYKDGVKIKRDILNSLNLKSKDGVILEKRSNFNVLSLRSDDLDNDRGGKIIIDILYNGITGERKTIELSLAKDTTGWKLFKNKLPVSKFHVKVHKIVVLGTVGISQIIME